jgi:DNA-binding NtrC family response regulator
MTKSDKEEVRLPVLIVSSEGATIRVIEEVTTRWMLERVACSSLQSATSLIVRQGFGLIFCEDRLRDGTYRDLLSAIVHSGRKARMVVLIPDAQGNDARREGLELGAFDVISTPCSKRDVQWVIIRATQDRSLSAHPWVA